MTLIGNVAHGGPTLRRVTLACSVMLALGMAAAARARMNPADRPNRSHPRPVTFASPGYDEEQPGHQLMISRLGEQV